MASAEKRGKFWRVRYKLPDGSVGSESGFETKKAAMEFGRTEEAKARHPELVAQQPKDRVDNPKEQDGQEDEPESDGLTVDQWIDTWEATQDVGISTEDTRRYLIKRFIRPKWGSWQLTDITTPEVNKWEKGLPAAEKVSARTAFDARSLLSTILGDAAAARPPVIPYNPAARPRNRGKRTGRRLLKAPPRTWATPLEALLVAERAALLSGQDDFVLVIAIAYTGMRWAEMIGLESEYCQPGLINVEWQLREVNGRFHRLPPKDDSYRSVNWAPYLPVDLPPFLDELIARQTATARNRTCRCKSDHGGSRHLLFTGLDGGHHRRSDYSRRVFRPACDGRYAATKNTPEKLVIADMEAWPGQPVASWPLARPGESWQAPRGNDNKKLVSEGTGTAPCPACGRSVRWLASGLLAGHKIRDARCPGSGGIPALSVKLV